MVIDINVYKTNIYCLFSLYTSIIIITAYYQSKHINLRFI